MLRQGYLGNAFKYFNHLNFECRPDNPVGTNEFTARGQKSEYSKT